MIREALDRLIDQLRQLFRRLPPPSVRPRGKITAGLDLAVRFFSDASVVFVEMPVEEPRKSG